jgi:hypothetical protein
MCTLRLWLRCLVHAIMLLLPFIVHSVRVNAFRRAEGMPRMLKNTLSKQMTRASDLGEPLARLLPTLAKLMAIKHHGAKSYKSLSFLCETSWWQSGIMLRNCANTPHVSSHSTRPNNPTTRIIVINQSSFQPTAQQAENNSHMPRSLISWAWQSPCLDSPADDPWLKH